MKNKQSVLITGSSKGLGKYLALTFVKNDYNIILHGRDKKDLEIVREQIGKKVNVDVVKGDLKSDQTIKDLYKTAKQRNISILINNASLHHLKLPLEELTNQQIEDTILTNLISPIKLTKKVYSFFLEKKQGTIININSALGLEPKDLRSVYCATKWGLRGFADSLRLEAEKNNIRIVDIYPSRIKTIPKYQDFGMKPENVAQEIYGVYKNTKKNGLIIDDRPEGKVKIKYI